uniref:Uncharacterized protein n=1 Tax=Glossina brevipalpis TaxID=37001 RepID=A0A1A9WDR3_9MUSC
GFLSKLENIFASTTTLEQQRKYKGLPLLKNSKLMDLSFEARRGILIHWVLAIVCNPDLHKEKKSQILLLDSMRRPRMECVAEKIRNFIEAEHHHRGTPDLRITADTLPLITIKVPQQENEAEYS